MEQNPENTGIIRDNQGRFIKGHSGNPDGRPEGAYSLLSILKAKLKECPDGMSEKSYGHLIIERMLAQSIKDGNEQMTKLIWSYIEGMPRQALDHTGIPGTEVHIHKERQIIFRDFTEEEVDANPTGSILAPEDTGSNRVEEKI
jgi:hypothetical protein